MTNVVNNSSPAAEPVPTPDSGGNGFLIGVIVVIGFVLILLYFGITAIRDRESVQVNVTTPQTNVTLPQVSITTPQVNVTVPQTNVTVPPVVVTP